MKKDLNHILSLVFAGTLLISIIGIPVSDHYCGGSFVTTNIGLATEDYCSDMPKGGDCCSDETMMFSVTDYFNCPDISLLNTVGPEVLVCNYTTCTKLFPQSPPTELSVEHEPPPIESKIIIEIQSFLL